MSLSYNVLNESTFHSDLSMSMKGREKKRRKGKFMLTITIFHLELLLRRKLFRANLESVSFSFAIVNKFMSFSRKAFK